MSPLQLQRERTSAVQDEEKLKELILLLSELSEGDEYFGATKLNKLLFYSDFLAYQLYGKPISGAKYEAQPGGPMLKHFYKVRDEMLANEEIAVRVGDFYGRAQHRTLALRKADVKKFSSEELDIIHRVLNEYRHLSASAISALSHEFLGWKAVGIGDEIPYEVALVSTRDLTREEYDYPATHEIDYAEYGIKAHEVVECPTR